MLLLLPLLGCPAPDDTVSDETGPGDSVPPGSEAPEPTAWAEVVDGITGPPNTGRILPTVTLALPGTPTELRAEDLDSDGRDELLLVIDGMLHVAEVDTLSGDASVSAGLVAATSFEVLGHHQVLVRPPGTDGTEVATFTRTQDGWDITRFAYEVDPGATLPIGDLDGDGFPDVATLDGTRLKALHAPIHPNTLEADVLLDFELFSEPGQLGQTVATGDRDGDGFEDLVVRWDEFVLGAPGPFARSTAGDLVDVLDSLSDEGPDVPKTAVGLLADLDGDGTSEVSWVGGSAVALVQTPDDAGRVYRAPDYAHQPVRMTAALAAWGGGAGWWYAEPDPNATRPQAEAVVGAPLLEAMARLGAADPVDYAWTEADKLHVVPAYGGLDGGDHDADGFDVPDDCDDADADVYPGAVDIANGQDDDCDGAVDELGDDLIAVAFGAVSDQAGDEIVTWPGPDGDRVAWCGALGLQVADLLAGTRVAYPDGPDLDVVAGDFDGDGQMDLAGGEYGWTVTVAYGPPDAAALVTWDGWWVGLDEVDVLGDLDRDGRDDLFVTPERFYWDDDGHPVYEPYPTIAFGSPERSELELQPVDIAISAVGAWDGNADGYDDLLVDDGSALAVIEGPIVQGAAIDTDTAGTWIRCTGCALHSIVLDDDGLADDLVALTSDDRLLVYRGPVPLGAFDLETESIGVIDLGSASSMPGVASTHAWIYVGMRGAADGRGAVYGFPIDGLGEVTTAEAPWIRQGWEEAAALGADLDLADIDGDDADELIVGSPGTWHETLDGAIFAFRVP